MMDCRLPRHPDPHMRMGEVIAFARQQNAAPSLIIAAMARAPLTAEEARTAELVRAGDLKADMPMIDGRNVRLGELRPAVDVLLGCTATAEQRDAAAQVLILCHHRPWRILASEHMIARKGLKLRGLA